MKRVVLMLALALVIPSLASAGIFSYYTTGSFSCGAVVGCTTSATATTSSVAINTTTVTFVDMGSSGSPIGGNAPTQATLGNFTYGGTNQENFTGVGFTLNLF